MADNSSYDLFHDAMNTAIRHKHFEELGFSGHHTTGYSLGRINIKIWEDDDRLDSFSAYLDNGFRIGSVKTKERLQEIVDKWQNGKENPTL